MMVYTAQICTDSLLQLLTGNVLILYNWFWKINVHLPVDNAQPINLLDSEFI